ncbi:hypothetical protein [Streptomyces zagrosensis]|uniref:Uncharacterized protein n=1 Tax=Streptomyces zagrosensis TaxID=1042984 RepID=A0A7W9QG50_9ACTN|nr:hypothetical protein [Streptomyces zagrosensis]MBB5938607.1 hypothetical protein [Streptomyces zagrosensis]
MAITPAAEICDQHIADLRGALAQAVRLLSFSAGQVAPGDPVVAERLMPTADEMTQVLNRTAPE